MSRPALGTGTAVTADTVAQLKQAAALAEDTQRGMPDFRVEETGLRPSSVPATVAGYEHVPFTFVPGKNVGGPRIVD